MDRMKLHAYKRHSIIHHPVKVSRPWLSLVHSAIAGGGSLRVCLVVDRLILATASVDESSVAVAFLSLHLLVDEPERMNVSWEIAKNCQADINEQVAAASGDERRCCRREYDGNENENDI